MKILVLCHLIPYPADNGAKMRIFNLTRQLARWHQVSLICPVAPGGLEEMQKALGGHVSVCPVTWPGASGWQGKLALLSAWPRDVLRAAGGLSSVEVIDSKVRSWRPDLILATDPLLGEYLRLYPDQARAVDIAAEYALYIRRTMRRAPMAERPLWLMRLLKWGAYTQSLDREVDLWLVTAATDRAGLRDQLAPGARIEVVPNGVDLELNVFQPNPDAPLQIAHCGALSYEPNYDALNYFCEEIWPILLRRVPQLRMQVTGKSDVLPPALRRSSGIMLTGYLPSVRPILRSSRATVVPLRFGVGTRLKIMEAMAIGTPVVATSIGAEGLAVTHGQDIFLADSPADFADRVIEVLESRELRVQLSDAGRRLVETRYAWDVVGDRLHAILNAFMEPSSQQQEAKSNQRDQGAGIGMTLTPSPFPIATGEGGGEVMACPRPLVMEEHDVKRNR